MFAFLDTPFDPDYPVYTRANAGELLPDPIGPLAWSVIGPAFEEGFRVAFYDDFGLLDRPGPERPYQAVGRMAGRLHLNLSVIRASGEPEQADDDAEEPVVIAAPQSHAAAGGRLLKGLRKTPAVGKTLAGLGRRVSRDRAAIDELAEQVDAALHGRPPEAEATDGDESDGEETATPESLVVATTPELIPLLRTAASLYGRALGTHVTAQGLIVPMTDQARGALRRADLDEADAERLLTDIDDLESDDAGRALDEIAARVPPASALANAFRTGTMDAIRTSDDSGAAELVKTVEAFIDEFGHWGAPAFDPTAPAWWQNPDAVVAEVARRIGAEDGELEPLDIDPGRLARPLVAAARAAVSRAERTRHTMMRATDIVRRLLLELHDRLGDQVGDELFWFCTLPEIETSALGGAAPSTEELTRRQADFAEAVAFEPAEWSDGTLRAVGEEPPGAESTDDPPDSDEPDAA